MDQKSYRKVPNIEQKTPRKTLSRVVELTWMRKYSTRESGTLLESYIHKWSKNADHDDVQ